MRISDALVEKLIIDSGKATEPDLDALKNDPSNEKKPLQDILIKTGIISEKELTKIYAEEIDVPYIELNASEIKREKL
jgi:hypothetical protein